MLGFYRPFAVVSKGVRGTCPRRNSRLYCCPFISFGWWRLCSKGQLPVSLWISRPRSG